MKKNKFADLRSRAEKILNDCRQNKTVPAMDMSQLIDELTIHQIELEIQNEDLLKTQSNLEVSTRKYIELYDLAPVGYFSLNHEGLITEVNQAGCHLLGLTKHALINRCFSRYIASEHQTLYSQYRIQAFNDMNHQSYEIIMLRWNQPFFYASVESKAIQNEHTQQKQLLVFATDISERKKNESLLHQQRIKMASIDRLRSVNELVFCMAKDQNGALMIMDNYLQGCIRRLESNNFQTQDLVSALKNVAAQSQTVSDAIKLRKSITSKSVFYYVRSDINTIIKQTISLLLLETQEYPVNIQFSEFQHDNATMKLDIYHIQQAILNLARNAIDSMRDNKTDEPKLLVEISKTPDSMIEVTLFDNGPGLNDDDMQKVFEPHYTTKSYGIGLGLTVSRVIIEKHGGELYARKNPSGGACFGFTLPCIAS